MKLVVFGSDALFYGLRLVGGWKADQLRLVLTDGFALMSRWWRRRHVAVTKLSSITL